MSVDGTRTPDSPDGIHPFRARPRNDFLTAEDVAAGLRWATVERNRGDAATADLLLRQLHRSAVRTWGVGHRKLGPIEAEMRRWNVLTAPDRSVSPNTDDAIPKAVIDEAWSEYLYPRAAVDELSHPPATSGFVRAMRVLQAWAAGCASTEGAQVDREQTTVHADPRVSGVSDDMVLLAARAIAATSFTNEFGESKNKHMVLARAALSAALAGYTASGPDKPKLLGLIKAVLRGNVYTIDDYLDSEGEPMKVVPAEDIDRVVSEIDRRWDAPAIRAAGSQVGDQR